MELPVYVEAAGGLRNVHSSSRVGHEARVVKGLAVKKTCHDKCLEIAIDHSLPYLEGVQLYLFLTMDIDGPKLWAREPWQAQDPEGATWVLLIANYRMDTTFMIAKWRRGELRCNDERYQGRILSNAPDKGRLEKMLAAILDHYRDQSKDVLQFIYEWVTKCYGDPSK
jgi:hypothetical protein